MGTKRAVKTKEPSEPQTVFQFLLGSFSLWVGIISGVLALVAAIWTPLSFLAASGELDLVVWIREQFVIYPTASTQNLPLPFEFEGETTRSAVLMTLNISNRGSRFIGDQKELWQLQIVSEPGSKVAFLGEPQVVPRRTTVFQRTTPYSNTVFLDIGVLEPGNSIELQLLVVNPPNPRLPRITYVPSLSGLPQISETSDPLDERVRERVFPYLFFALLPILIVTRAFELRSSPERFRPFWRAVGTVLIQIVFLLFATSLFAWILSLGIGWIVARILLL
jgi:hypothetical protein